MIDDRPVYLDASALVKLVVEEPESAELQRYLRSQPKRATCALSRAEVVRAVREHGVAAIQRATRLLTRVHVLRLDDELLRVAALLDANVLRSLDAIHVAAALAFGEELTALVTYDRRMAQAAESVGLEVAAPGSTR